MMFTETYITIRKALIGTGIGKHPFINSVNERLLRKLKKDHIQIGNHEMYLDKGDALELSLNGIYEPEETELVRKLIHRGNVVVDIGAHIGYYTLIFAELVGEGGLVFAFEPDKDNFALLKKNVETNGYTNVILVNKAVTNRTGMVKIIRGDNPSTNPRVCEGACGVEVGGISLDDYFQFYKGTIDLIKMDIEGGEYNAVIGMGKLLHRNPHIKLITEYYPKALMQFEIEGWEYLNLLKGLGFTFHEINDKNRSDIKNLLCTKG